MPIRLPSNFPSHDQLISEHIDVIDENRAARQDIRPLRILIVNLMPKKLETEAQILRLIGNTALQIEVDFIAMESHVSKNVPEGHLETFYKTFAEIRDQFFDGIIVTGAPVEQLEFEEVDYWPELCEVFEWSKSHCFARLSICWGAQADLHLNYGIEKRPFNFKFFGVFRYRATDPSARLVAGLDDYFWIPQSRHTGINDAALAAHPKLKPLCDSSAYGPSIVSNLDGRNVFVLGHLEYDRLTLDAEYRRDRALDLPGVQLPENYYRDNDPDAEALQLWKSTANIFFGNWINFVYQETPFDLTSLPELANA